MTRADRDFLRDLIARGQTTEVGYFHFASLTACLLPADLRGSLRQLVNGPVWDGDVLSKHCRDALLEFGLAVRVCHKGQQGFTGATYFAFSVLKYINEMDAGRVGP